MTNVFEINEDWDFGFTSVSENELPTNEEQLKGAALNKAQQVYEAILPLLNNLAKDGDKNAYIHWPNRTKKIEEFKKKLQSIVNS